jgi:hypothetical protein
MQVFFAKNQINHAAFMAARAGAVANADLTAVRLAYARALVPLYGGGTTPAELAASLARTQADMVNVKIDLLNPTKESFADWNDADLQEKLGSGGQRVIPNTGLALATQRVGASSGQTLQDANLIKLRITQGYLPKGPLVRNIYQVYWHWLDDGSDLFHSKMVAAGRTPVVTYVTLHMQSDAIEPALAASAPGAGNGGHAVDLAPQGAAGVASAAPRCDRLHGVRVATTGATTATGLQCADRSEALHGVRLRRRILLCADMSSTAGSNLAWVCARADRLLMLAQRCSTQKIGQMLVLKSPWD